jgi:hypothetical protein
MDKENERLTWQRPWKYKEGFIIAGGLFLVGLLLDFFSSTNNVEMPGWPFNIIVGLIYILLLILLHISYRKLYTVQWLSSIPACLGAIALFAVLTLCIGLIPQAESKDIPATLFKFNYLKQSWLFLLATVYLLTCLGLVTLRRSVPFNFKNIGFMTNHLGLWLIIFAAGLSSSDFQRYQVAVEEGQTTSKGLNLDYKVKELPFSLGLIDFTIDEFPAKLALVDAETNQINTKLKNNLTLIEGGIEVKIKNYKISISKYLPSATVDSVSVFRQTNDSIAVQAAYLKCYNINTNSSIEGWISSDSPKLKPTYLKIDSNFFVAMTLPDPKKFSSKILVTDSKGVKETVQLEVNKPYKVDGWKLYQIGYDKEMGKYSRLSIIEAVRDPWIPVVYIGIILMILGAGYLFWIGRK